mmetsp:Transcript_18649/g.24018  ORF Transcript_18649/g.24018 Transcript_18649/m.24018 type:complete len:247 (+) Transcript_18649:184-924(+)|eukprot:CAMPEP_0198153620 /NCGR_PEP_ID=MMETSP1443-20131203/64997_1 /TAXON_ID=186043 /ORGANISM="Entomoneis sp., Strain CCMP2396" /LENGTH=246 /DNA_ID=CAMNT_0043820021 /DNA_START=144 /DNA_END=884 /DNA_ORIENTATION=+
MTLCCIGGVCVPYSAVIPLLVLGLKFVLEKMVQLGLIPQWMQDKVHAIMGGKTSTTTTKSCSNSRMKQQQMMEPKIRRSSRMKQNDSTVSNTTETETSCCCSSSSSTISDSDAAKEDAQKSTTASEINITTIESEEDWTDFVTTASSSSSSMVVVKMTAEWCQPCKAIQPLYEKFAKQYASSKVIDAAALMDVDELDEIAAQYSIAALPTFLAISNGRVVERYSGSNEAKLQDFFVKLQEHQQKQQ